MKFIAIFLTFGFMLNASLAGGNPKFPPSFPKEKAEIVLRDLANKPHLSEDIQDLWDFDALLGKTWTSLRLKDLEGKSVTLSSGRRTLLVFALSDCHFAIDQIRKLLNDGWRHQLAQDVFIILPEDSVVEVMVAVPELNKNRNRVRVMQKPYPEFFSTHKGSLFSVIVLNYQILAVRVGTETVEYGAWQIWNKDKQNDPRTEPALK